MPSISPRLEDKSNLPFILYLTLIVAGLLLVIGLVIYFSSMYLSRSEVDGFYRENRTFNILLSVNHENQNRFLAMAVINPEFKRAGLISFFQNTALNPEGPVLSDQLKKEDTAVIAELLADMLGYEENFYIDMDLDTIIRYVDIIEGFPYFLWSSDKLEQESLPTGEFFLDGVLTREYLASNEMLQSSAAVQLFRHYSFLLNAWENREEKWDFIDDVRVFSGLIEGVRSNMSAGDLYRVSKRFYTESEWKLYFLEVPVSRQQSRYVIDREATALYLKKFKSQISSSKLSPDPPRMDIQNGAGVNNLAKKMRYYLSKKGIQVLEFTNADHNNYKKSILVNTSATPEYAVNVKNALGVDKVFYAINKSMFTDLVLILGSDYKRIQVND